MRLIKDKITWYDLYPATEEDLNQIKKSFKLNPLTLEELKTPSSRQKVELFDDFLYVVMRFPVYDHTKKTSAPVEIDFLIKPKEIATIRYEKCEPLDEFFKNAEELEGFRQKHLANTSAQFLHALLTSLFTYGIRELTHIDKKIAEIADLVFAGKEKDMIKEISLIKRDILDFRRITKPVEGLLHSLRENSTHIYPETEKVLFLNLLDEYSNLKDLGDNLKDTIESLEVTNQTLLSSKIDEVMRLISILAFTMAPFTIVGTLFQINTLFTPIIGNPYDWWIITGISLSGCVLLYLYFKKRNWL